MVNCVSHAKRDAADKLGLKRVPPVGSSEDLFSIYDGSRFVFRQSPWSVVTLWRMVQRYWLTYFTFAAPKQMLQKFLRLYDLQRHGVAFDTPEAFLSKLELYELTQQSMHDYLKVTNGVMCYSSCLAASLCMMPCCNICVNAHQWKMLPSTKIFVQSRDTGSLCPQPLPSSLSLSLPSKAEGQIQTNDCLYSKRITYVCTARPV